MGLFRRTPQQAAPPAETRVSRARETTVADLARRIGSADSSADARADQVRALPGGQAMVAEAIRRAAR